MAQSKVNDMRGTRMVVGLVPALYDRVTVSYPDSVTEIYAFFYDGTQIAEVTMIYNGTDDLISAERTS